MNELQVFKNEIFGEVRTVVIDGEIWFVLADVCRALGLSNPRMVAARLDEDERRKFNLPRQGDTYMVNESGLYKVLFRSDKEEAKTFTKWVTKGILPQIRKTGTFTMKTEPKDKYKSTIEYAVALGFIDDLYKVALKYEATIYKNGRLYKNYGGNEYVGGRKKLLRVCNKSNKRNAGRY